MATKTWRRSGGKPSAKMRDIKFDIKAIREIQERKKRVGKGHKKHSKRKGRWLSGSMVCEKSNTDFDNNCGFSRIDISNYGNRPPGGPFPESKSIST